jgi:hypothetical protein
MSWHVETEALHRYQTGHVDRVSAASLETHVTGCAECREGLLVDAEWLEGSWARIAEQVEPGEPSIVERVLTWVGVPPHLARVMAVTPSLRPSWLLAVTLTLVFASLASRLANPGDFDLFLLVAPLVPVAGVAVAYGRLGDPAHEMSVVTPIDTLRLLLLRVAAVTGFAVVLSTILDIAIPLARATGLWILPSLALTLVTLALGTHLAMWTAAATSAAAWLTLLTVFLARPEEQPMSLFAPEAQVVFLLVALIAALLFALGRDEYRTGGER